MPICDQIRMTSCDGDPPEWTFTDMSLTDTEKAPLNAHATYIDCDTPAAQSAKAMVGDVAGGADVVILLRAQLQTHSFCH
jgi:hypothetical protein